MEVNSENSLWFPNSTQSFEYTLGAVHVSNPYQTTYSLVETIDSE